MSHMYIIVLYNLMESLSKLTEVTIVALIGGTVTAATMAGLIKFMNYDFINMKPHEIEISDDLDLKFEKEKDKCKESLIKSSFIIGACCSIYGYFDNFE